MNLPRKQYSGGGQPQAFDAHLLQHPHRAATYATSWANEQNQADCYDAQESKQERRNSHGNMQIVSPAGTTMLAVAPYTNIRLRLKII